MWPSTQLRIPSFSEDHKFLFDEMHMPHVSGYA
jgi:hypothetical protein